MLESFGIVFKEYNHGPILNYEEAEREQRIHGWQGVESKNVLLKGKSGRYYIVATVMGTRLDMKMIRELLGEKCSIAPSEDVAQVTGCVPGSIAPFGFSEKLSIFVDEGVFQYERYLFSPADPCTTIELTTQDLRKVFDNLGVVYFGG